MTTVICKDLTKTFGSEIALNNLSCTIADHAITGLIGRNGAGKTTLLKTIAGFYRPTSGTVEVFASDPFNSLKVSANTIFIDDSLLFPKSLTLQQIFRYTQNFYPNWDQKLADNLLAFFALDPHKYPVNLSKGMLSTFKAILGLCSHCPLTIMDEPTSGMDAGVRKDFYRALLKDYLAQPRTIILSSHLLGEIEDLLENILLIDLGTTVLNLPVAELQQYAISLSGKTAVLQPYLEGKTILHQEQPMPGYLQAIVVQNYSQEESAALKQQEITLAAVSANDLCTYLTTRHKGGIDHVFD